jgi:fucose permease
MVCGLGSGLTDGAWNAWIGNMANATEVLGFLHGAYGAGAIISPVLATALITKTGSPWYYFYYFMVRRVPL